LPVAEDVDASPGIAVGMPLSVELHHPRVFYFRSWIAVDYKLPEIRVACYKPLNQLMIQILLDY
jgi:hypothetical protein